MQKNKRALGPLMAKPPQRQTLQHHAKPPFHQRRQTQQSAIIQAKSCAALHVKNGPAPHQKAPLLCRLQSLRMVAFHGLELQKAQDRRNWTKTQLHWCAEQDHFLYHPLARSDHSRSGSKVGSAFRPFSPVKSAASPHQIAPN
jgi:hypothetical protein